MSTISIQLGFLPTGTRVGAPGRPVAASIGCRATWCESCPAAIRKRPDASTAKPRGVFSVGTCPSGCSCPVAASTRNVLSVLEVRSYAYSLRPSGDR